MSSRPATWSLCSWVKSTASTDSDLGAQHLLPKVRACIDHKGARPIWGIGPIHMKQGAGAQPAVPGIWRMTHPAITCNHRHTLRGAGAEKCEVNAHMGKVNPLGLRRSHFSVGTFVRSNTLNPEHRGIQPCRPFGQAEGPADQHEPRPLWHLCRDRGRSGSGAALLSRRGCQWHHCQDHQCLRQGLQRCHLRRRAFRALRVRGPRAQDARPRIHAL